MVRKVVSENVTTEPRPNGSKGTVHDRRKTVCQEEEVQSLQEGEWAPPVHLSEAWAVRRT